MFYKKQNTSILIICLCIIVAGFGFLGGYFVSGYSVSKSYAAKVSSYNKQIADLKKENQTAETKIEDLKKSQSDGSSDSSSSNDTENAQSSASSQTNDENSSSAYSQTTNGDSNDSDQTTDNSSNDNALPNTESSGNISSNKNSQSDSTASNANTANASKKVKYILKIYNNKPTIFDYTNNKIGDIQSIINMDINALSKSDKALLEKGIVINSEEELAKVLEDYSS